MTISQLDPPNPSFKLSSLSSTIPPTSVSKPPEMALSQAVESVVDDMVSSVATSTALEDEKKTVQTLITNLVCRVHRDAEKSAVSAQDTRKNAVDAVVDGGDVPYGDHRLRRLDERLMWVQTVDAVTVNVSIPNWVGKRHVDVEFDVKRIKVKVEGEKEGVVIDMEKTLMGEVDVDYCTWAVDDTGGRRLLTVELEKLKERWWRRLFEGGKGGQIVKEQKETGKGTVVEDLECDCHGKEVEEKEEEEKQVEEDLVDLEKLGKVVKDTVDEVVEAVVEGSKEDRGVGEKVVGQGKVVERGTAGKKGPGEGQKRIVTRADLTAMVEQYKEAFKKGGEGASTAALQLATFYHHGIGVEQSDAQAARLYKYALEHGKLEGSAAFQLGLIYNSGATGLEPDAKEAVRWWRVAAELGNAVAMFNLGVMMMNGSGCDMDPVGATGWFEKAERLNPQLKQPQFTAGQLEERMKTAEKLKRQRMKEMMSPEEKKRRREEALRKARTVGYGSLGIVGAVVGIIAIRYWMKNRL